MKEYNVGIKHEKSALDNFAEKYTNIDGKRKITPFDYFKQKAPQLKDFLRNHTNIKVRMIMTCLMEQVVLDKTKPFYHKDKAYFNTETFINLESTDIKEILSKMIRQILNNIGIYQKNGSGWYFKEVLNLEIHTVNYKPMKGSSYIPLPDFITKKKVIINIQNKDEKCFQWSILRYLYPLNKNGIRVSNLKKYENELNFNDFPVKLKDITIFENQNPSIPGINVFSVNENNKIYPLRLNKKDSQKSVDFDLY